MFAHRSTANTAQIIFLWRLRAQAGSRAASVRTYCGRSTTPKTTCLIGEGRVHQVRTVMTEADMGANKWQGKSRKRWTKKNNYQKSNKAKEGKSYKAKEGGSKKRESGNSKRKGNEGRSRKRGTPAKENLETKITKEIVEHGTHKVTCQLSIPNALLQKYAIRVPSVKAIGVHNNLAKASTFAETKVKGKLRELEKNFLSAMLNVNSRTEVRADLKRANSSLQNWVARNNLLTLSRDKADRIFGMNLSKVELSFPPASGVGRIQPDQNLPLGSKIIGVGMSKTSKEVASRLATQHVLSQLSALGITGKIKGLSKDDLARLKQDVGAQFFDIVGNHQYSGVYLREAETKSRATAEIKLEFPASLYNWTKRGANTNREPFLTEVKGTKREAGGKAIRKLYDSISEISEDADETSVLNEYKTLALDAQLKEKSIAALEIPKLGFIHHLLHDSDTRDMQLEEEHRLAVRGNRRYSYRQRDNTREHSPEADETLRTHFLEGQTKRSAKTEEIRANLPITQLREELLNSLKSEQVIVISGGTGSGKTTQIPQYILDDALESLKGSQTHIVVTQPRRIAAVSVAERVAAERGESIGESVGYRIRLRAKPARNTGGSIEFCTTGMLLKALQSDPVMKGTSCVIIDEVHERDLNTDFLLLLMKDLIKSRPDLKLILMSATLDASEFSEYFNGARIVEIPSAPRYPVKEVFLEDLPSTFGATMGIDVNMLMEQERQMLVDQIQELSTVSLAVPEQTTQEEKNCETENKDDESLEDDEGKLLAMQNELAYNKKRLEKLKDALERLDETIMNVKESSLKGGAHGRKKPAHQILSESVAGLIQLVVKSQATNSQNMNVAKSSEGDINDELTDSEELQQCETNVDGSILCFMPGWEEIKAVCQMLETSESRDVRDRMLVLPLHSSLTGEEQERIFKPAPPGKIKVIVATNIAESSVTINDVITVIDSGKLRQMNYNSTTRQSSLDTALASQANAVQRKGRTGRVGEGTCYRLYSREIFDVMSKRQTPEIQRTDLQHTCLQSKLLLPDLSVHQVLSKAIDPPPLNSVDVALSRLEKLGALSSNTDLIDPGTGECMTRLGSALAKLSVEPSIGRMLIWGALFKCIDPVTTMAALLSVGGLFVTSPSKREESQKIQMSFSVDNDLRAMMRAYHAWESIINESGLQAANAWAHENMIMVSKLMTVRGIKNQVLRHMSQARLVHYKADQDPHGEDGFNLRAQDEALQDALVLSGMPHNLAWRSPYQRFQFRTELESRAMVHPSSVNCDISRGQHVHPLPVRLRPKWLMYREMVRTSESFLRTTGNVSPLAIALFFGYNMEVNPQIGPILDDWIICRGDKDSTLSVMEVRKELECIMLRYTRNPKNLTEEDNEFLSLIAELLHSYKVPHRY
eukprot:m.276463 g.276463  ORF g.276463 m.276463 type:complete len:1391 (-) comp16301_c0_seq14:1310-5482(-)